MDLKCKINGIEKNIVQGHTFAEELNETLDCGSIIISGVSQINDIYPYDDVFIYSGEFNGYPFSDENPKPSFYKHLLVDQFTEEIINLDKSIYKYKIELMSETKGLEVVQLPNRSITQPLLFGEKKSVWEYAKQYVELYSPKIKFKVDDYAWEYKPKYTLDSSIEDIFKDIYSPDFSLNNPSLRDVLSKLFIVKDCIPYVKDDVIYALDISKRNGAFDNDPRYVNLITGSLTSDNYCNNLRREYSNALAQNKSGRLTEFLGFRNSENALMTLDNMRLEFGNEIYKINKFYMCYYKQCKVTNGTDEVEFTFLCKQDITKLIKLNTERDLLSQDWDDLSFQNPPTSIDDLAKYKICTLGYDIGSQFVTDWGKKFTIPQQTWAFGTDTTHTYIETIYNVMNSLYPLGVYDVKSFLNLLPADYKENGYNTIVENSFVTINYATLSSVFFKTLFFEVDYTPFYSGCSVITRPDERDTVTINDNSSESLSLLEKDGLFQQEKIKRFGNKGLQINARYTDFSQMQELGTVYNDVNAKDIVIYHREYSIYDNVINCKYYGTKNYVLKNYYTSVFAKYRTWSLMAFDESVKRAENEKQLLVLSKDAYYSDDDTNITFFAKNSNTNKIELLCSAFTPSPAPLTIDYFENPNLINFGCIGLPLVVTNDDGIQVSREYFVADVNVFANGNSLCLNLKMKNNLSSGTFIKKLSPDVDFLIIDVQKDYKGTQQSNYMNVDSLSTGEIEEIEFVIGHLDYKALYFDGLNKSDLVNVDKIFENQLFVLPKIDKTKYENNLALSFSNKANRYKDNKEFVNMTFQFEPLSLDESIIFSNLFMQLNDLGSYYNKFEEDMTVANSVDYLCNMLITPVHVAAATYRFRTTIKKSDFSKIVAQIPQGSDNYLKIRQFTPAIINYKTYFLFFSISHTFEISFTSISNVIDSSDTKKSFTTRLKEWIRYGATDPVQEFNWTLVDKDDTNYIFEADYKLYRDGWYYKSVKPAQAFVLSQNQEVEEIKTYPKNMYVLTSEKPVSQQDIYKEMQFISWQQNTKFYANTFIWHNSTKYKVKTDFTSSTAFDDTNLEAQSDTLLYDVHNNEYTVLKTKISDIFSISSGQDSINSILVDITDIPSSVQSVQYWFADNDSVRLVFGVNINSQDVKTIGDRRYIQTFVSTLTKKDLRVFDELHNVVGKSLNYTTLTKNYKANIAQLYQANGVDINDCFVYTLGDDDKYVLGDNSGESGNAVQTSLRKVFNDTIVLPDTYNGKEVKGIADNALQSLAMTTLYTKKGLKNDALKDCAELIELTLPAIQDTEFGDYNVLGILFNTTARDDFYEVNQHYNTTLEVKSYIPNSLTKVTLLQPFLGTGTFSDCKSLFEVILPQGITQIPEWTFAGCESLNYLTISDGVVSIGDYALQMCKSLEYIVLPVSLKTISLNVGLSLDNNSKLKIFYKGIYERLWNAITGVNTDFFTTVTHYLYSETEPTTSGNYWHYVNNVPTIW